MPLDELLMVDK